MLTENDLLQQLLQLIFPVEIIEHFTIRIIDVTNGTVHVHFYENNPDSFSTNDFELPVGVMDFPIRDKELVLHLYQQKKEGAVPDFLSQSGIINAGRTHTASFAEFIKRNEQIRLSSAEMNTVAKVKQQYQRLMDYCNELEQEKGTLIDEINLLKRQLQEYQGEK